MLFLFRYVNLFLKQQNVSWDLLCFLLKWQFAYFEYRAVKSYLFSSLRYLKIVAVFGALPLVTTKGLTLAGATQCSIGHSCVGSMYGQFIKRWPAYTFFQVFKNVIFQKVLGNPLVLYITCSIICWLPDDDGVLSLSPWSLPIIYSYLSSSMFWMTAQMIII